MLGNDEVSRKLDVLRQRRAHVKATIADLRRRSDDSLDAKDIAELLDTFGGLVGLEPELTDEERRDILAASGFTARYNPTTKEACSR